MPSTAPGGKKQDSGCRYNGDYGGNGEVVHDHLHIPL